MSLSDEFITEVNAAVEQVVSEAKAPETPAADATEPGKPAPETVVETSEAEANAEAADREAAELEAETKAGTEPDKGATTPAAKEPPPPAAAPVKPTISDSALTKAVYCGLSLEDARQFPSEQALLRVVASMDAAKQFAPKAEEKVADEDPLAGLPKLDPEVYEPEVIKMFDALVGVVKKQQEAINSFQSQHEQSARHGQESAAREVEQWFDKQVSSLGKDFEEALGTGGYGTLDRGSEQFARRDKIANQVAVLIGGYRASGQQAPPREEVFDAAARLVLRDEYQKVYEKNLTGDLAKRSSQHVNRAGGQKTKNNTNPLEDTAAMLDARFFKGGR